jgi:hypothetical protein
MCNGFRVTFFAAVTAMEIQPWRWRVTADFVQRPAEAVTKPNRNRKREVVLQ